jgi:hypothetical protein
MWRQGSVTGQLRWVPVSESPPREPNDYSGGPAFGTPEPTEMAHWIRDKVRADHRPCEVAACPLSWVHAEDVQAILDAQRDYYREHLGAPVPAWVTERYRR